MTESSDEMVALGRYRVVLERDETGAWIADFPDVAGCHTYGRTLRQARARLRDVLALFATDADTADLDEDIRIGGPARLAIARSADARADADLSRRDAADALRQAVETLSAEGLPIRDIGGLLELSPSRVQQLLAPPPPREDLPTAAELVPSDTGASKGL
jgi:predicted RNase H-like HicB family nuclease